MIQIKTIKQARAITGGIGKANRKMPFFSFGLNARLCKTGSILSKNKKSPCFYCYAKRNMFNTYVVKKAHLNRHKGIKHPNFIQAFTYELNHLTKKQTEKLYFRWHDSGDLQSIKHLLKLVKISKLMKKINFWMPTSERKYIRSYLKYKVEFPLNFSERVSSPIIDIEPKRFNYNTSSTFKKIKPINSKLCYSIKRGGKCGNCRACWHKNIRNIAYKMH